MSKIERTASTPEIEIENNVFKMTGVCTPENPPRFFDTFKEDFELFITGNSVSELIFHLDYFNTGSSKCLLNMFKSIHQLAKNSEVKIHWIYEAGDDEMKESGELYAEIAEMEFNFIESEK